MRRLVAIACLMAGMAGQAANEGLVDFGVAYYPEAWPESRWETDLGMMNELGIDLVRIGEFNWSGFEPTEGVFDFAPYLRFLDRCREHGVRVLMCTPTAATPKWMQRDYPETEKTRADGSQPECGGRQSSCASSPKFRAFSRRIVERMAAAFKDHPAVTGWQLDNELSVFAATEVCVCERCRQAYVVDLKRRYGTLENLNREFNGCFWSSAFTKWEDVRLPFRKSRRGWCRDYFRFQGDQFRGYVLEQAEILRRANPSWRLTSNNPAAANFVRLDLLYRNLGYASTDTYIGRLNETSVNALLWKCRMFCGLTGRQKPFMVGESGPFSFDADATYGYDLVKPWFWLCIGNGAESFCYFRWRESVAGEETHPAILPWSGRKGFVFDLLKRQMDEYRSLPESIARLPLDPASVAIVRDADSHTYEFADALVSKRPDFMEDGERNLLVALERRGIRTDIVPLADDLDFAKYKVLFCVSHLSVSPATQRRLRAFVADGGVLVAVGRFNMCSPLGGRVCPEVCPVGMTDFFGLEIDERRTLACGTVELVQSTTAETVMPLADTCFKGRPLLTRQENGKGSAWYCSRFPTPDLAREIVAALMPREGFSLREELPPCVSRMTRGGYTIVVNYTLEPKEIAAEVGKLLLGSPEVRGDRMTLAPLSVSVWK